MHNGIWICITTLVRRALVKVCTVPMLLVSILVYFFLVCNILPGDRCTLQTMMTTMMEVMRMKMGPSLCVTCMTVWNSTRPRRIHCSSVTTCRGLGTAPAPAASSRRAAAASARTARRCGRSTSASRTCPSRVSATSTFTARTASLRNR